MEKTDHVEDIGLSGTIMLNAGEIGCDTVYWINVMQDIN